MNNSTSTTPNSALTCIAIQAALAAGDLLRQGFGTTFRISAKEGKHNPVTEFDQAAEKLIIDSIHAKFPSHAFLGEESGASHKDPSSVLWIIDPLDGTLNYSRSVPIFVTSIAAYYKGEILCGVIYQPMTQELFVAEKGQGAYLNGKKLSVSTTDHIDNAFCGLGLPVNDPHRDVTPFARMIKNRNPLRDIGAAALNLAYLAAGRFDAYWIPMLYPWDVAAGQILIEEAGGKVTDHNGKPYDLLSTGALLATNGLLHPAMVKILTDQKWT